MDEELRKELLREELKKKFKGKQTIEAKYVARFPDSAERAYLQMVNDYMAIERDILKKHIPELKRILNEGTQIREDSKKDNIKKRKAARFTGIDTTIVKLGNFFDKVKRELESAFGLFGIKREMGKVANLNHKLTVKEWKKVIGKTLGINLLDDYYNGDAYQQLIEKWISDNVDLIKTIPADSLGKMKELVYKNYMDGTTTTDIIKELEQQYGIDRRHARLIARDQTAKLNAAITKHQQQDAGVDKYKWRDARDERVRESHHRLNGHVFSWDDPPETDGGRHCHPGEDYQCRCTASAVLDIDSLDLPV